MGDTGIMTIFDFILIVYGIYSITTARKMRQDHQVPQWLVSQQDLVRIRQPKELLNTCTEDHDLWIYLRRLWLI